MPGGRCFLSGWEHHRGIIGKGVRRFLPHPRKFYLAAFRQTELGFWQFGNFAPCVFTRCASDTTLARVAEVGGTNVTIAAFAVFFGYAGCRRHRYKSRFQRFPANRTAVLKSRVRRIGEHQFPSRVIAHSSILDRVRSVLTCGRENSAMISPSRAPKGR